MAAFVGALLVAPIGWSGLSPAFLADAARLVFALLLVASGAMLLLGAVWSRRWTV
jgi:hypothetical protein